MDNGTPDLPSQDGATVRNIAAEAASLARDQSGGVLMFIRTRLLIVAMLGALLLLAGCKGAAPSPYQQEMDDRYGGKGGY